jgi:hypothetical protein
MIARRFAFAVLGHRCDNPLCHRVAPNHVRVDQ